MGITLTNIESHRAYHSVDELKGVLTELSDWLSGSFPGSYVFFLNTESFVVVSLDEIDPVEFNEFVQARLAEPFVVDGIRYIFHASTFVVDTPNIFSRSSDMVCAINLIERQLIKRNTDGVYYITSNALDIVNREKLIQDAVERGVDNDSFEVYFQPLVNSSTRKVEGAEALCRLNDTKLGFVSPAEFIPIAEASGAILVLGLQVFHKVCQYASTHDLEAMGIKFINVNVSPVQYQDIELVDKLYTISNSYNLDFSLFDFEITETANDTSLLYESQLQRLTDLGASVSLDDFGTGSSNLARLLSCPISVAKLDMSLVWGYFKGENSVMVGAIDLFKSENLKVVAEGVEDEHMVEVLSDLNCEYLQGFYFSKPIPFDEFTEYVYKFNNVD